MAFARLIVKPRRIRIRGGAAVRRELRNRLAEAQNWRCAYCHCSLDPETATIEHVHPLGLGGAHDWENMVVACRPCNAEANRKTMRDSVGAAGFALLGDAWPAL